MRSPEHSSRSQPKVKRNPFHRFLEDVSRNEANRVMNWKKQAIDNEERRRDKKMTDKEKNDFLKSQESELEKFLASQTEEN